MIKLNCCYCDDNPMDEPVRRKVLARFTLPRPIHVVLLDMLLHEKRIPLSKSDRVEVFDVLAEGTRHDRPRRFIVREQVAGAGVDDDVARGVHATRVLLRWLLLYRSDALTKQQRRAVGARIRKLDALWCKEPAVVRLGDLVYAT